MNAFRAPRGRGVPDLRNRLPDSWIHGFMGVTGFMGCIGLMDFIG